MLAKSPVGVIIGFMAKKADKPKDFSQIQIKNKKAWHTYEIVEKVEAGVSLLGTEVKSLRAGQADLDGAYARIDGNECWLIGAQIAQYPQAGMANHEPLRKRKLLLHKNQISKITVKLQQRGFTLVPLRLYIKGSIAKVEVALARGKKLYDKRESIARREAEREMARAIRRQKY